MEIKKFRLARASNRIYQDFEDGYSKILNSSREQPSLPGFYGWVLESQGWASSYHATRVLNMNLPKFRLARASNRIYQDFEHAYQIFLDSSRKQPDLPGFWRWIFKIFDQLARATKSTRILRMSLGEPGFTLSLPCYQGFEYVLTKI